MNRTLREIASTTLIESGLPEAFWAEAVQTAVYTKNRCPNRKGLINGEDPALPYSTPFERLYSQAPFWGNLQTFGCAAYVSIPREKRVKVLSQHRAWKGIFIGYTKTTKQYRVWDTTRKVISVARDVRIVDGLLPARDQYDKLFPYWQKPHDPSILLAPSELSDGKRNRIKAYNRAILNQDEVDT